MTRRGIADSWWTIMSKRKHAIDAHFQSGVRLHSAGRLQEAEQVYRQIIASAPGHADSYHMLGVIARNAAASGGGGMHRSGDHAEALGGALPVNRASALLAWQAQTAENGCRTTSASSGTARKPIRSWGMSERPGRKSAIAAPQKRCATSRTCPICIMTSGLHCDRRAARGRQPGHAHRFRRVPDDARHWAISRAQRDLERRRTFDQRATVLRGR
jgi:hypothetical protein